MKNESKANMFQNLLGRIIAAIISLFCRKPLPTITAAIKPNPGKETDSTTTTTEAFFCLAHGQAVKRKLVKVVTTRLGHYNVIGKKFATGAPLVIATGFNTSARPSTGRRNGEDPRTGNRQLYPGGFRPAHNAIRGMAARAAFILLAVLAFWVTPAHAQTTPGQVAAAVDDLKRVILLKFDDDIQKTATGFADAKNINNSARWADWFRAPLDISLAVFDGLMAMKDANGIARPDSVRTWVKDGLVVANTGHKAWELATVLDRYKQDGVGLALAIDGPAYSIIVQEMLDRADAPSFFDYTVYRNSILNDLTGASGRSPLRIPHKSTKVDREGLGVFNSANDARTYIAAELDRLSAQVRQASLPVSRLDQMLAFIQARKTDILNAWAGQTRCSYMALLDKDGAQVSRGVNYSLGTISALNIWRGQMASAYADNTGIEIEMRVVERASDFVVSSTLDDTVEMVNLNLSVKAVLAGGVEANDVLKEASTLGWAFGKPNVGQLSDQVRQFASNAREQVNQVPAQMFDALPGEISKTLLLLDDSTAFAANAMSAPFLTGVIIIGPTSVGENSTVSYVARAAYNDGTYKTIAANWTEDSPNASISTLGVLTTGEVSADSSVRVTATYSEDGITKAAGVDVTIVNGGFKALTALSLSGPTSLAEGQSAVVTATARYNDGTSQTVSPTYTVSGPVTMSGGTLTAGSVSSDSTATLTATYSSGGVTKTAFQSITILNVVGTTSHTSELVSDGGFESLTTYWSATGGAGTQISRLSYPHTGTGYASSSLNDALGSIHQIVYFPANATGATLTFWISVSSAEPSNGNYDLMDVNLRTSGDVLIRKLASYSEANRGTAGVYQKVTIDVTPYLSQLRGQSIVLQFWFDTDSTYVTTFRVDDVSMQVVVPDPKTLAGIVIFGPSTIRENTTEPYSIKAEYSDGTEASLLPSLFGENSPYLTFNGSGVLSAAEVSADTAASLFASYTEAGVTRQAFKDITILNVAPILTGISINGASSLDENSTTLFSCTGFFSDYTTQTVTPVWSVDSGAASISASGQLSVGEVAADTLVHVTATYSLNGQTKATSRELLVRNRIIPTTYNITAMPGTHGTVTPNGSTTVTAGSTIVFLASPDVGYDVDSWTVNGSTAQVGGGVFVLSNIAGPRAVAVSFKATPPTFALIVNSGQGVVTRSPDAEFYLVGTSVILTAVPPVNTVFLGWSGTITSTLNPVTITVQSNMVVAAQFGIPEIRLTPPTISLDGMINILVNGSAGVSFTVQSSTNLTVWETAGIGQIPASGVVEVQVTGSPHDAVRFYRAIVSMSP